MDYLMLYIWLGIFLVCFLAEVMTFDLVTVWFCVGSLVCIILSLVIPTSLFWVEIIVFFVVSLICLALVRPLAQKALQRKVSRSNVDEIVGKKGKLLKDTSEDEPGEMKVEGLIWTTVPNDRSEKLLSGEDVEVVSIDGNKLRVRKDKKLF
jgi:membrane protein implicated in regulation of membrane protease activity